VCIKTKAKKSVTITITIAIILFSCNSWVTTKSVTKTQYAQLKSKMSKDWKNANPKNGYKTYQCPKCGTKNMFLSHVNADYVPLAEQRQLTNGQIKYIIFF